MKRRLNICRRIFLAAAVVGMLFSGARGAVSVLWAEAVVSADDLTWQGLRATAQDYFSRKAYDDFFGYLKTLAPADRNQKALVAYYSALARHKELLFWEQTKNWEGVYDKSEGYRREIQENLDEAEPLARGDAALLTGCQYLRWQELRRDDQDRAPAAFETMVTTAEKAASSLALIDVLKDAAEEMISSEDKIYVRQIYAVYVSKFSESGVSPVDVRAAAVEAMDQGRVFLAKALFEAYVNKLDQGSLETARELVDVANRFAHQDRVDGVDPMYADQLYGRADQADPQQVFAADDQFRRAFNLERMKDYQSAIEQYKIFVDRFSGDDRFYPVHFRLGVLCSYGIKNIEEGMSYFQKIMEGVSSSPLAMAGAYQMGLICQWQEKTKEAQKFYERCREIGATLGQDYVASDLAKRARERLDEIQQGSQMKYALRMALQGMFSQAQSNPVSANPYGMEPVMLSVDLVGRPPRGGVPEKVTYATATSSPQTGCMVPEFSYEWSGDIGGQENIPNAWELAVDYSLAGMQVVFVAVMGPSGLEGASFEEIETGSVQVLIAMPKAAETASPVPSADEV